MVLLHLNDKQKDKISLLNTFDETIIKEFCRISTESVHKEINQKTLNNAAQKLELQVQDLKDLIEMITWIFIESARLNLSSKELKESLILVGIKPELVDEIEANVQFSSLTLQNYMCNLKIETLSYENLEWRLDIKLATRSLRKLVEPEIILKLDLKKSDSEKQTEILQTDIINLVHLTNSLEDALNEIKTNYCRRVFRNIV